MAITVCSIVCRFPVRFVSRFRKSIGTTSGSLFACVTFGTTGVFRVCALSVTVRSRHAGTCTDTCCFVCRVGGSGRAAAHRPCAPDRLHPSEHDLFRDDHLHVFSRSDTALAIRGTARSRVGSLQGGKHGVGQCCEEGKLQGVKHGMCHCFEDRSLQCWVVAGKGQHCEGTSLQCWVVAERDWPSQGGIVAMLGRRREASLSSARPATKASHPL